MSFLNVFGVNVAHNDDFISPGEQIFGDTLRAVGVRVVAQLFERKAHLSGDFARQRSNFAGATTLNIIAT